MKSKIFLLGALAATVSWVAACSSNHDGGSPTTTTSTTPPPVTSTTMALDTAQVLAMAQQTSETSSPIAVNGNALVLTDTSETTTPISVSAQ